MPLNAKLSATAADTGTVEANTAIGTLEASMLDTATTSSMTNSMKVLDCSSFPTGWMRMNIQASPKNRSSMMKRNRHWRMLTLACGSSRNWRHLVMMTAWITSTALVQVPAVTAPVHSVERKPTVPTSSRITSEADSRFCANRRSSS